jgi:hypothetical protein
MRIRIRGPGSGMEKFGSVINIPDPQRWKIQLLVVKFHINITYTQSRKLLWLLIRKKSLSLVTCRIQQFELMSHCRYFINRPALCLEALSARRNGDKLRSWKIFHTLSRFSSPQLAAPCSSVAKVTQNPKQLIIYRSQLNVKVLRF